jgi:hypothetical protein
VRARSVRKGPDRPDEVGPPSGASGPTTGACGAAAVDEAADVAASGRAALETPVLLDGGAAGAGDEAPHEAATGESESVSARATSEPHEGMSSERLPRASRASFAIFARRAGRCGIEGA